MQTNRYRIPLLQILRDDGSLDFSRSFVQTGEYFINEIEFNNAGRREPERTGGDLGFEEKVATVGYYGAVTEMKAKTFNSLTPLINENNVNHSNGPLRTPFLFVQIGEDRKVGIVAASGGRADVRRFIKLMGDDSATLPVALFIGHDGKMLTAGEITQGMLRQVGKGIFAQNHDDDPRHLVNGPLYRQAVVDVVGYSFENMPSLKPARTSEFTFQPRFGQ
jgi:hypothetical protein